MLRILSVLAVVWADTGIGSIMGLCNANTINTSTGSIMGFVLRTPAVVPATF